MNRDVKNYVESNSVQSEPLDVVRRKVRRYYKRFPDLVPTGRIKNDDASIRAQLKRIRELRSDVGSEGVCHGSIFAIFKMIEAVDANTSLLKRFDIEAVGVSTAYQMGKFKDIDIESDLMELMIEWDIGHTHPALRVGQKIASAVLGYSQHVKKLKQQRRSETMTKPTPLSDNIKKKI